MIHGFLKIFLPWTYITSDNSHLLHYCDQVLNRAKNYEYLVILGTVYSYSIPCWPCPLCSLVILSVHAHLSITGYLCLHRDNLATLNNFVPHLVPLASSYHALLFELLLVDTDYNYMRIGSEVCTCTVSLPCAETKIRFIN